MVGRSQWVRVEATPDGRLLVTSNCPYPFAQSMLVSGQIALFNQASAPPKMETLDGEQVATQSARLPAFSGRAVA